MAVRLPLLVLFVLVAAGVAQAQDARAPIERPDCQSQDRACTCLTLAYEQVSREVRDASVVNSCAEVVMVSFCQYSDRQPQPDAKCDLSPVRARGREFFARINDCEELVRLFACTRANHAAGRCRIPDRVVAVNRVLQGASPR